MSLASDDRVRELDGDFGRLTTAVGQRSWSLPGLSMREKTFVFIAADLCVPELGFVLGHHVQQGTWNGVSLAESRAAVTHLAPYVGYPIAATALQRLAGREEEDGEPRMRERSARDPVALPATTLETLRELDEDFAWYVTEQFTERWLTDTTLSARERALTCLAVDVMRQTLEESFALHLDLAGAAGADAAAVRTVLLILAEYGLGRAWRAYRAAQRHLGVDRW